MQRRPWEKTLFAQSPLLVLELFPRHALHYCVGRVSVAALKLYLVYDAVNVTVEDLNRLALQESMLHSLS